MTRDDAITLFHQVTYDSGKVGTISSTGQFTRDRAWAEKAIDGFVALGILKLEEPKTLPQRLRDFIMDTRLVQGDAMARLEQLQNVLKDCGLKIVEAK